jgi:hypothetical protein
MNHLAALALVILSSASCSSGGEGQSDGKKGSVMSATDSASLIVASVVETAYPERVYWGDQHLHTSWSGDAGAAGTTIGPEEAVRFATGLSMKNNSGQMVQLGRPLDWLAVSDHSDGMGAMIGVIQGDPELMKDTTLARWNKMITSGDDALAREASIDITRHQSSRKLPKAVMSLEYMQTVWERNNEIMDRYNKPGKFTAFIAYEWTSNFGGGNNLHRNIIYRDNAKTANMVRPLTTFETEDPEGLWKWMQSYEDKTGGKILAIPHNGNLSNGLMFSLTTLAGKPFTREYADKNGRCCMK